MLDNRVVRFGPFTLNTETRELCRNEVVVKLRGQPYLLLEILLAHADKVVTREQIRLYLWPADTYVDFDRCLNTAVMKLRHALRDSADAPRYIETIPRIGYRFIAALEVSEGSSGPMNQRMAALTSDQEEIVERFDNLGAFRPQEESGLQHPTCVSASLNGSRFLGQVKKDFPGYSLAVLVAAVALLLRRALDPLLGLQHPYHTMWLAVALSARHGKIGPFLTTLLAGAVGIWYFLLPPRLTWYFEGRQDVYGLVGFVVLGALFGCVASLRPTKSNWA